MIRTSFNYYIILAGLAEYPMICHLVYSTAPIIFTRVFDASLSMRMSFLYEFRTCQISRFIQRQAILYQT